MPHMVVSPEHFGRALEDLETGGQWVSMMPGMPACIPSTPFLWVENFSPYEPLFQEGDAPLPAALITVAQPHDLGSTNQPRPWDARCGREPGEGTSFLVGVAGRCPLWSQPFQTVLVSRANGQWCQPQLGPQQPRLAEPPVKTSGGLCALLLTCRLSVISELPRVSGKFLGSLHLFLFCLN